MASILIVDLTTSFSGKSHPLIKAIFANEVEKNVICNDEEAAEFKWRMVTKYFEADLQFSVLHVDSDELLSSSFSASDFVNDQILEKYRPEAVLYYYEDDSVSQNFCSPCSRCFTCQTSCRLSMKFSRIARLSLACCSTTIPGAKTAQAPSRMRWGILCSTRASIRS